MAISVNVLILGGYLTRDVELRYTPKGTQVATFGVAVNRTWKDEAGEKHQEVSFVDCVAWGRTAEVIGQYFKKGSPILVQGYLRQESWDDKTTGKRRYAMKAVVTSFNFVSSAAKDVPEDEGAPATPAASTKSQPEPEEDSDIPF